MTAAADIADTAHQSPRFLLLYALAVSGGAVAYIPFLTILLPLRASILAGDDALTILSYAAFVGAITASGANIFFGWISDLSRTRRPWIAAGMLLSSVLLAAMPMAANPVGLLIMIVGWQTCLNMMLAPLAAWAGDTVPDHQKGLLGGLLACAPAVGAMSGALVTLQGWFVADERLIFIAILVILMVSPALLMARPLPLPHLATATTANVIGGGDKRGASATRRMWLARLLVQIAEASLFAFLLLWFRAHDPNFAENDVASIFAAVLSLSVFCTLIVGRWSDRGGRPIVPIGICAGLAATGLLVMAAAPGLAVAIAGYIIFGVSGGIFLALHSSQTLRVLPSGQTRGRDLGLFNLTNTIPSLIMPWLTLALVPAFGFGALFAMLACFAAAACFLLLTITERANGG